MGLHIHWSTNLTAVTAHIDKPTDSAQVIFVYIFARLFTVGPIGTAVKDSKFSWLRNHIAAALSTTRVDGR